VVSETKFVAERDGFEPSVRISTPRGRHLRRLLSLSLNLPTPSWLHGVEAPEPPPEDQRAEEK
jgi:hypothetical protein